VNMAVSLTMSRTRLAAIRIAIVAGALCTMCTLGGLPGVAAAQEVKPGTLAPDPEFAQFPRYTGLIGSRKVELLLGPKTDEPEGMHGEYHLLDTGEVILVAGDRDGNTLELEESDDGTRITGQWVAQFSSIGGLTGDRTPTDGSDPQPLTLHLEPRMAPRTAPN
jgi:hypothetical protein